MEITNNIDELYNLIESNSEHQTFIDNLELWTNFYNNREFIIENNILNPNLIEIIKFLLQQENGEISNEFANNIVSTIIRKQIQCIDKIQKDYNENKILTDTYQYYILLNFNNHNDLCSFINGLNKEIFSDNDIKDISISLETNTVISLTESLYNNFFDFEPEQTKDILKFITITTFKMIFNLRYKINYPQELKLHLLEGYLQKILPIKMFIGIDIANDILVKSLKENEIKDKFVIFNLFYNTKLELFLAIFKYNLNSVITFLNEADYLSDSIKEALFYNLLNTMLRKEDMFPLLLDLIIKGNNSNFMSKRLWDCFYNKILISSMNYTICSFNSDMIKFILTAEYEENGINDLKGERNYQLAKQKFIIECRYLLAHKEKLANRDDFDIEGIESTLNLVSPNIKTIQDLTIYKTDDIETKANKAHQRFELGLEIDFNNAISLLSNYFENKIELTLPTIKSIIRSICLEFQKHLEIENNGVYYYLSNESDGIFNNKSLTISINDESLITLLDKEKSIYERIQVIISIFHEITHSLIEQNKKRNIWTFKMYEIEKENIIRIFNITFYEKNYIKFKEEIEAQIQGIDYTMKFIETYLPNLLDMIQDDLIEELKAKRNFQNNSAIDIKQCFDSVTKDIHIIFDKLIQYNPYILAKHPIFKLEYYEDGRPKTKEDILASRTEENKDLIDDILKRRYPDSMEQTLKSTQWNKH